jgi:hypothetical protein
MKRTLIILITVSLLKVGFSCSCFPWNDNFYENVSVGSQIGIIRLDSTYLDISTTLPTPMAIFSLISNISIIGKDVGDTLLLYGQDGLNCAVGFNQFNIGDTLVAALSGGSGNLYSIPFFGSGCGVHYLKISGGQHDGLDFDQIEDKIEDYITSINSTQILEGISIKNNPVNNDQLHFSKAMPINSRLIVFNSLGQILISLDVNTEMNSMDFSTLPAGIYQVAISYGNSFIRKQVLRL